MQDDPTRKVSGIRCKFHAKVTAVEPLHTTPKGGHRLNFSVLVYEDFTPKNQEPQFVRVTCWDTLATENATRIQKDRIVTLSGVIRLNKWIRVDKDDSSNITETTGLVLTAFTVTIID